MVPIVLRLSFGLWLSSVCLLGLSAQATPRTVGTPGSGVELGLGWNSDVAATVPNRCVVFAPVQERGQTLSMNLHEVSDTSEVMDRLGVSASMAVKSAVGSGSARAEFAQSTKVSNNSSTLLIKATVSNGVLFAGPAYPMEPLRRAFPGEANTQPLAASQKQSVGQSSSWFANEAPLPKRIVLSEAAKAVLGNGSLKEQRAFRAFCGDSYVSAIHSGAELLALMNIKKTSKLTKEKAAATVKASFSAWGVSGSGSSSAEKEKAAGTSSSNVEMTYTQVGGAGGIIPTSKADFFNKLHALPAEALEGPEFYAMELTPYSDLPDWPSGVQAVREEETLEDSLNNYYWTLTSIDLLLADYTHTNATQLQDRLNKFRGDILDLLEASYTLASREATSSEANKPDPWAWLSWLWAWALPEAEDPTVAERRALDQQMQALLDALMELSFGYENPNLIKLYLPVPGKEQPSATEVLNWYVTAQNQRTCATDPRSKECMSHADLKKLLPRIPTTEH
jgi:hypothetical protein